MLINFPNSGSLCVVLCNTPAEHTEFLSLCTHCQSNTHIIPEPYSGRRYNTQVHGKRWVQWTPTDLFIKCSSCSIITTNLNFPSSVFYHPHISGNHVKAFILCWCRLSSQTCLCDLLQCCCCCCCRWFFPAFSWWLLVK